MNEVTVVVPTRNRRPVLAMTLASIRAQREVDLRIVVVDEGSTDDTPAYLESVHDPRLVVVRHDEPQGLAAARNAGLQRAETDWVAFCDDDDLWAPDKLASQLAEVERVDGARWSCTGTVSIDEHRRIIGHHRPPASGDVHELMQSQNVIPGGGSTVIARTSLAVDLGGYDAWFTGCEDFEFYCSLASVAPVAAVDRPLVAYRVWTGTMSTDVTKMRTGHRRVLERHRGQVDPALVRAGELYAEQYWARFHLRNRERTAALAAYAQLAWRHRLPGQLAYAALGAVAPGIADRHQANLERRRVPAAWAAEARAWLDAAPAPEPAPAPADGC